MKRGLQFRVGHVGFLESKTAWTNKSLVFRRLSSEPLPHECYLAFARHPRTKLVLKHSPNKKVDGKRQIRQV